MAVNISKGNIYSETLWQLIYDTTKFSFFFCLSNISDSNDGFLIFFGH